MHSSPGDMQPAAVINIFSVPRDLNLLRQRGSRTVAMIARATIDVDVDVETSLYYKTDNTDAAGTHYIYNRQSDRILYSFIVSLLYNMIVVN